MEQERQKRYLLDCIVGLFKMCSGSSPDIPNVENEKRFAKGLTFSRLADKVKDFDFKIADFKEIIGLIDEAVFSGVDIKAQLERSKDGGQPISLRLDLRGITGRPSEFLRYESDYEKFAAMMREAIELLKEVIEDYTSARNVYEAEIVTRTQDAKVLISQFVKHAAKLCKDALQHKVKMQKFSARYSAQPSQDVLSEYSDAFASFQSCASQYRSICLDELPKITAAKPTLTEFPTLSSEDVKLSHDHLSYHHCDTALGVY